MSFDRSLELLAFQLGIGRMSGHLTNLHWLSVNHRRKLGMRRISEAGIEAMAVQIVVDHWRLGRAPATPRHWSRCCATYTVLSNTTGSSSVTVLKTFIHFG